MRVLHVISALDGGTAAHQLRLLVRRLPHDCEVVTLSPPGVVADALRADGVAVHVTPVHGDHDLAAIARMRRLMRSGHFEVVHTHCYRANVLGRIAARLAGVPYIVATEQFLGDGVIEGRPATAGVRAGYLAGERLGRVTIAVTPAIARRLRAFGVPEERITVIPMGIDAAEFRFDPGLRTAVRGRLGIAADTPVIGGVGRLAPGKRFDRLIRAVGQVPDAKLLLVGDGPARGALERLAAIEGVADRVVFAGAVGHTRAMLCAMDVFASPSDRETFGAPVLEALAAGLPALYATCPPLEELARARAAVDGARRLSPHDRESLPRALRAELLCLAERRGARLPVRSAGSRHDAARLAASVDRVYERLTDRRRAFHAPLVPGGARG
jgi:glycosyltransferase involved in cell wall biosynthesis